jgi:hypothetical protein
MKMMLELGSHIRDTYVSKMYQIPPTDLQYFRVQNLQLAQQLGAHRLKQPPLHQQPVLRLLANEPAELLIGADQLVHVVEVRLAEGDFLQKLGHQRLGHLRRAAGVKVAIVRVLGQLLDQGILNVDALFNHFLLVFSSYQF